MMRRKILLFALLLLLISAGIVVAESSTHLITQRFVLVAGGTADSANYTVTSVFGQPATDVVNSANL